MQEISMATPADPRCEKLLNFFQFLGGEKLFEKCRWNIFSGLRGAWTFSGTLRVVFQIFFAFFKHFSYRFRNVSGAISFCRRAVLIRKLHFGKEVALVFCFGGFPNGGSTYVLATLPNACPLQIHCLDPFLFTVALADVNSLDHQKDPAPGSSKCRFVLLLKGQFHDRCIWALF